MILKKCLQVYKRNKNTREWHANDWICIDPQAYHPLPFSLGWGEQQGKRDLQDGLQNWMFNKLNRWCLALPHSHLGLWMYCTFPSEQLWVSLNVGELALNQGLHSPDLAFRFNTIYPKHFPLLKPLIQPINPSNHIHHDSASMCCVKTNRFSSFVLSLPSFHHHE